MAALSLPAEVAEHLQAAILLSTRRVHLRLLDDAEKLVEDNLLDSAVLLAGSVLESYLEGIAQAHDTNNEERISHWRSLRNYSAHHSAQHATIDQAKEMLVGVRGLIRGETDDRSVQQTEEALRRIQGKYSFVATDSAGFIERKAEELRLEHQ